MANISTTPENQILATKLFMPAPRPKVVARPRLIQRLDEGLHAKLMLIAAPAGFGKTTLVSAWLAQSGRSAAWLSLDARDGDLSRFLAYLVAALQTIVPGIGDSVLEWLNTPQPPTIEVMLTALLNEIAAVPENVVVVLDDYHLIDARAVDEAMAFLLAHQPPQLHVVLCTREDPPLPLARMRGSGHLHEVRAADLRFAPDEAAAFLNQVMGLSLSEQDVDALEARTEGWVAGLQLAALSMQGRNDATHFVRAFAGDNRYIVDYLIEEVLQHQPQAVRDFLLQTSILDRLSGPLCDAVTEQANSKALLDALERANLFVIPLDDQRLWFRYHHLFADVLAAHLQQEQPALAPILHQRASAWYADNGLPAEAIRHALAGKDFVHAAALIELAWPEMDGHYQSAAWLAWARALPDALLPARPVLSAAFGWALLNGGEMEAADLYLRNAEMWFDAESGESSASVQHMEQKSLPGGMIVADAEQYRTLAGSVAAARAYMALAFGDIDASIHHSRRALTLLPKNDLIPHAQAASLLGLANWASGDLEAAHQALADAMANFERAGNLHFAIGGAYGLAEMRATQGRLRAAVNDYAHALHLALAHDGPLPRGTADLHLGLSELSFEQGAHAAAAKHLLQSESLGVQMALPDWHYRLCRTKARFALAEGDHPAALALLEEAERHYIRTPVPDARPLAAWKARVWLAQGQLRAAQRWVQEAGLTPKDALSYVREFEHITLARVLMAEYAQEGSDASNNHLRTAMNLLERLLHAAEDAGRMGNVIEICLLLALAQQERGNTDGALAVLARALALAEPEGYGHIFVDEGAPMKQLLAAAAAQGIMPDYIGRLLTIQAMPAAAPPNPKDTRLYAPGQFGEPLVAPLVAPPVAPLVAPLVEPLSARELEILELINQGLSNQEIGARLFLALSTVKGHNRNIFGKLQVQRRTEAVARARALGIL
jgi:LuxR family maltose regulon positive regulatory protein